MKRLVLALILATATATTLWLAGEWRSPATHDPGKWVPARKAAAGLRGGSDSEPVFARILSEGFPELTAEQIESFVESRHRSAASLLSAFYLSGDESWLEKAQKSFPDSPELAMAMIERSQDPESRAEWIALLKKNDPDNAAGVLFSAQNALETGDASTALAELESLSGGARADFFGTTIRDGMGAAYRHAGHGGLVADWAGFAKTPVLGASLTGLNKAIAKAMENAHTMGDNALTEKLGKAGMDPASRILGTGSDDHLISRLISVTMQRQVLNQLDTFDLIPGDQRQIVADRLIELDQEIDEVRTLTSALTDRLGSLSDADAAEYTRRFQAEGEYKALRWLISRESRE